GLPPSVPTLAPAEEADDDSYDSLALASQPKAKAINAMDHLTGLRMVRESI
ncbi:MAG: hypothetical protein SGPRY_013662, partial [Prymnesium sp.]